jgi:hypothetical protein
VGTPFGGIATIGVSLMSTRLRLPRSVKVNSADGATCDAEIAETKFGRGSHGPAIERGCDQTGEGRWLSPSTAGVTVIVPLPFIEIQPLIVLLMAVSQGSSGSSRADDDAIATDRIIGGNLTKG